MTRLGVDYAWGYPGTAALSQAGATFAARYHSNDKSKNLRPDEARALLAAGIDVVSVWETTADRMLAGYSAGVIDAHLAAAEQHACGAPPDAPIYFAADFDATPAQQAPIDAYLSGAASVIGKKRTGIYGGFYVVKRALDAGVCHYGWQTYAWSGGQWEDRAQLQQFHNGVRINKVSCDLNRATAADFGQWTRTAKPKPPAGDKPLPGPTPKPRWFWAAVRAFLARRNRDKRPPWVMAGA